MQDLIGRRIGQYQIVERVGGGGMATVYKAIQPSLNRAVAIKILPPSLAADPTFRERFRREATGAASLQHPNIVPVYDFGQDGDLSFIVMMLVSGGTLKERIGKLSLPFSLRIAGQLADALAFAHSQNIVHRDVKPSNVLMARDDWALLSDFGIARLTQATGLTNTGTGIGTPEYMSPEQAMGQVVDGRADVYALGIMLFELVTGRLPFAGPDGFAIMRQHVQAPLPRPSSINPSLPAALDAILLRATEKDPAARYQTGGEMKSALDAVLGGSSAAQPVVPDPNATVVMQVPRPSQAQGGATSPYGVSSTTAVDYGATSVQPTALAGGGSSQAAYSVTAVSPAATPPPIVRRGGNRGVVVGGVIVGLLACLCIGGFGAVVAVGALPTVLNPPTSTPTPTRTATATAPRGAATPTVAGATATRPPSTPTRVPVVPTFTPVPVGRLQFEDGFAGKANPNQWDTPSNDKIKMYFDGSTYHLENTDTGTNWVSYPRRITTQFRNFIYEADITKLDGPDDANFGIAFRAVGVDGYNFFIRGDGTYQLTRYVDSLFKAGQGGFDRMIEPTKDSANLINRGNTKNRLKVAAIGTNITIYVNDRYLGQAVEFKSEAKSEGAIGVIAGPGVHIVINAVRVFNPG